MSTEPRGSKIVQGHKFAISGSTSSDRIQERIKRKRSLDDKTENKRDKLDLSISDSESNVDLLVDMATEKLDIKAEIRSAIADEDFLEMLSKAFAKKLTEELKHEISEVREQGEKTDKRVDDLEIKVDDYEQDKRAKNVVISGIPNDQAKKEGIRKLLNAKLKCNVAHEDIAYIVKLRRGEDDEKANVRVAFTNEAKKKQVMSQKKNLKGEQMWITDDITPYRNRLAYLARQAVKNGHAHQSWISAGKIFIKAAEKSKPTKVRAPSDIPGYQSS
jgi:hypothetical protein